MEEVEEGTEDVLEEVVAVDVADVEVGEEVAPEDVSAAELDVSVAELALLVLEASSSTSVHASGTSSLFCWPSC